MNYSLLFFCFLLFFITGHATAAEPVTTGSVQGKVTVLGKGQVPISPKHVIVTLKPLDSSIDLNARAAKTFKIKMRNKTYTPSHLVVQVGDSVYFPNPDRIKHNVFSSSEGNRFDLGSFRRGMSPEVAFKNPGLVKIYCNVHKKMFTYVWVMAKERSMITNKDGFYHISDLAPGRYTLTAWHVRGQTTRTVLIKNSNLVIDLSVDGTQWTKRTRPKKSGVYPAAPQKSLKSEDWSKIQNQIDEDDEQDDYDMIDDFDDEEDEEEDDEDEEFDDSSDVEKNNQPAVKKEDDFEDF